MSSFKKSIVNRSQSVMGTRPANRTKSAVDVSSLQTGAFPQDSLKEEPTTSATVAAAEDEKETRGLHELAPAALSSEGKFWKTFQEISIKLRILHKFEAFTARLKPHMSSFKKNIVNKGHSVIGSIPSKKAKSTVDVSSLHTAALQEDHNLQEEAATSEAVDETKKETRSLHNLAPIVLRSEGGIFFQ